MADDFTTWCPTPPLQVKSMWRMNVAQYGDGYQQRILDGINARDLTISVSYDTRPQSEITAMNAYLIDMKSKNFWFRDPVTGVMTMVFCDEWDIEWNLIQWDGRGIRTVYGTLSADFTKANGVSVEPL